MVYSFGEQWSFVKPSLFLSMTPLLLQVRHLHGQEDRGQSLRSAWGLGGDQPKNGDDHLRLPDGERHEEGVIGHESTLYSTTHRHWLTDIRLDEVTGWTWLRYVVVFSDYYQCHIIHICCKAEINIKTDLPPGSEDNRIGTFAPNEDN